MELAGEEIDLPWETISHLEWLRQQVGPNQLVVGLPLSAVRDGRRTEELGRWIEQTETSLAYTGFVGGRTQVLQLADRPPQLLAIAPSLAASLRSRSVQCRQLSAVAQACTEIGCQALITGARCQDDVDACQELGLHLVVWPAPQGSLTGR